MTETLGKSMESGICNKRWRRISVHHCSFHVSARLAAWWISDCDKDMLHHVFLHLIWQFSLNLFRLYIHVYHCLCLVNSPHVTFHVWARCIWINDFGRRWACILRMWINATIKQVNRAICNGNREVFKSIDDRTFQSNECNRPPLQPYNNSQDWPFSNCFWGHCL